VLVVVLVLRNALVVDDDAVLRKVRVEDANADMSVDVDDPIVARSGGGGGC